MVKQEIAKLKEKLETEQKSIEAELEKFAKKDEKLKGDWDTRYPQKQTGATGSQLLEEEASEVEAYATLLPIEHNLELRLQKIRKALDKIAKGSYGKCKKCGKPIAEDRLEAYPAAVLCAKCEKIKKE